MGETLADIARRDHARGDHPELVVRHKGAGGPRRSKIVIDTLDFFYGTAQALKRVCLTLPEHQVTGMIVPSGCGKSTLLRVLKTVVVDGSGKAAGRCGVAATQIPQKAR